MPQETPGAGGAVKAATAEATSELRRLIGDLDQRIARQQKRVEKIIINGEGLAVEAQALLDDMIKARDLMLAQLEGFEKEARA